MPDPNPIVYSTEWGRMCPKCNQPIKECVCKRTQVLVGDGIVRVERQSKGRKGKPVCLIRGVPLPEKELQKLHKELKQLCGCGGTIKDGVMEIQGDHRERISSMLTERGYKVKIVGAK